MVLRYKHQGILITMKWHLPLLVWGVVNSAFAMETTATAQPVPWQEIVWDIIKKDEESVSNQYEELKAASRQLRSNDKVLVCQFLKDHGHGNTEKLSIKELSETVELLGLVFDEHKRKLLSFLSPKVLDHLNRQERDSKGPMDVMIDDATQVVVGYQLKKLLKHRLILSSIGRRLERNQKKMVPAYLEKIQCQVLLSLNKEEWSAAVADLKKKHDEQIWWLQDCVYQEDLTILKKQVAAEWQTDADHVREQEELK
jgi:hypothetical protein